MTPNFPLVLQSANALIPVLLDKLKYAREGCLRGMRSDRRESFIKLFRVLLSGVSLQHDGSICRINGRYVRPKTREEMAAEAGLSVPTVDNLLRQLTDWGYLSSKQVKRKNKISGQFEVSPGMRVLTPKFWEDLGLLDAFKKSVAWAKKNCKRVYLLPFKVIALKAKEGVVAAKDVIQTVFKALSPERQKIVDNCNKIRAHIRQLK